MPAPEIPSCFVAHHLFAPDPPCLLPSKSRQGTRSSSHLRSPREARARHRRQEPGSAHSPIEGSAPAFLAKGKSRVFERQVFERQVLEKKIFERQANDGGVPLRIRRAGAGGARRQVGSAFAFRIESSDSDPGIGFPDFDGLSAAADAQRRKRSLVHSPDSSMTRSLDASPGFFVQARSSPFKGRSMRHRARGAGPKPAGYEDLTLRPRDRCS